MNNKIVSTKKTSAVFLAIVMVTGTIAAISPTFIIKEVNAQGEPYYGMYNSYDDKKSYGVDDSYGYSDYQDDKDNKYDSYGPPVYGMDDSYDKKPVYGMDDSYDDRKLYDKKSYGNDHSYYESQYSSYGKDDQRDKSKDSKVDIKKIKCNNININANGRELNETSFPFLSDIIGEKESDADERGVSSYGSDERSYGDKNYGSGHSGSDKDFAYVCINNINNTVVIGEEEEPDLACEECFGANSRLQTAILDFLVGFEGVFTFGFFEDFSEIGEGFLIGSETDTIEQLCAQIENAAKELGVPLSTGLIEFVFSTILEGQGLESEIDALIECLLKDGIIVDREPPPLPISDNGIAGADVQCIGDPICARIT